MSKIHRKHLELRYLQSACSVSTLIVAVVIMIYFR